MMSYSCSWSILASVFITVCVVGCAQEFEYTRLGGSATSACVRFRMNSSYAFSDLQVSSITPQSAVVLCKTFSPTAVTGTFESGCFKYSSSQVMSADLQIDCPYNADSVSDCAISGPTVSDGSTVNYYYQAQITCVDAIDFKDNSPMGLYWDQSITVGGTVSDRSISTSVSFLPHMMRPSSSFSGGTFCFRSDLDPDYDALRGICRTVGVDAVTASVASTDTHTTNLYISNIKCPSNNSTLWNGCTYDTTLYNASSKCVGYVPKIKCYGSLRMRLGPVIQSSGTDAGFQRVELSKSGVSNFDGELCTSSSSYHPYNVDVGAGVCGDLYPAGGYDFAAGYANTTPDTSKVPIYLSQVECASTATSLASCTGATYTPSLSENILPCNNRGVVTCKMNEYNTRFSLERTSTTSSDPGVGYLMAAVSATGQAAASVCSNGFNQAAALAACRSLGYTPGPNAYYSTTSVQPYTYTINRVNCATGANKLIDCNLRYSGLGHKLSYSDSQECYGGVLLTCDLGTPTSIKFRVTPAPDYYLQAQLYDNAQWGWVGQGSQLYVYDALTVMCSQAFSRDGDINIQSSFMTVTACRYATTFAECSRTYTNGISQTTGYMSCPSYDLPAGPPSSTDTPVDKDRLFGIGAAIGAVALIVVSVGVGVICMKRRHAQMLDVQRRNEASQEMLPYYTPAATSPHSGGILTMGWHRPAAVPVPPVSDFYASSQPQPFPSGQSIYGQYGQPSASDGGSIYATHTQWHPNATGQHQNTGFDHL